MNISFLTILLAYLAAAVCTSTPYDGGETDENVKSILAKRTANFISQARNVAAADRFNSLIPDANIQSRNSGNTKWRMKRNSRRYKQVDSNGPAKHSSSSEDVSQSENETATSSTQGGRGIDLIVRDISGDSQLLNGKPRPIGLNTVTNGIPSYPGYMTGQTDGGFLTQAGLIYPGQLNGFYGGQPGYFPNQQGFFPGSNPQRLNTLGYNINPNQVNVQGWNVELTDEDGNT